MAKGFGLTYGLILLLLLSACYEKNARRSGKLIPDMHQDDESEEDTVGSTLQFVDTFKLLPVATIYADLKPTLKTRIALTYPQLGLEDSLDLHDKVELLAVATTYANWGEQAKNKIVTDQAMEDSRILLAATVSDSLMEVGIPHADSLETLVEELFVQDSLSNEQVYYEAIQWLENLNLTLSNYKNVRNKKQFEALVIRQLENGDAMLDRLYYYQEYPPIAFFSQHLLDILDCKHYTFDVTQLQNEVINLRALLLESAENKN